MLKFILFFVLYQICFGQVTWSEIDNEIQMIFGSGSATRDGWTPERSELTINGEKVLENKYIFNGQCCLSETKKFDGISAKATFGDGNGYLFKYGRKVIEFGSEMIGSHPLKNLYIQSNETRAGYHIQGDYIPDGLFLHMGCWSASCRTSTSAPQSHSSKHF